MPMAEHPHGNFSKLFPIVTFADIKAKQDKAIETTMKSFADGNILDLLADRKFELIESGAVNFYPGGIEQFDTTLQMREIVALRRWNTGEDYTLADLLSIPCRNG
jgi:hypothetical protein